MANADISSESPNALDQLIEQFALKLKNLKVEDVDTSEKIKKIYSELLVLVTQAEEYFKNQPDYPQKYVHLLKIQTTLKGLQSYSTNESFYSFWLINPSVILENFKREAKFITKYCTSQAQTNTSSSFSVDYSTRTLTPQKTVLSIDLKTDLDLLSKMVYIPSSKIQSPSTLANASNFIIYNNDGYNATQYPYTRGNPLSFTDPYDPNNSIPIGYNIAIPRSGLVKAVYIEVYGGLGVKLRKDETPGNLRPLDNFLLNNDIMVIRTNLYDLLKMEEFQSEMSETMFRQLQESIHHLYKTLKNNPESLHPNLIALKSVPYFLGGGSFGGLMAIRHAELFPHTFDGYLSVNGALSIDTMTQSTSPLVANSWPSKSWLDPKRFSHLIKDKLFLSQTLDDNVVHAKVLSDFYHELCRNDLGHLASLSITEHGNRVRDKHQPYYKGHFGPTDQADFNIFGQSIIQFIQKSKSRLPALTEWRGFISDRKANLFYQGATVYDRFIGYCLYSNLRSFSPKEWDEIYNPKFLAMLYIERLKKDDKALQTEIKRLFDNDYLTDEVIKNAILEKADVILDFFNEFNGINTSIIKPEDLLKDPQNITIFRALFKTLSTDKPYLLKFMLEGLYLGNPALLPEDLPRLYPKASQTMRRKLQTELKKRQSHVVSTWKQAIRQVKFQHIKDYTDLDDKMLRLLENPLSQKMPIETYLRFFESATKLFPRYSKEIIERFKEIEFACDKLITEGNQIDAAFLVSIKLSNALLNAPTDRDAVIENCAEIWRKSFPSLSYQQCVDFITLKLNEFSVYVSLGHAIKSNNLKMVNYLFSKGEPIDVIDASGNTPLYYAIQSDNHSLASFLIERGADVNFINPMTKSPLLHTAAMKGNVDLVKLMLKSGANPNLLNANNLSVLMYADTNDMLKELINHGAALDPNNDGALMVKHLMHHDHTRLEQLIALGIDVNAMCKFRLNPSDPEVFRSPLSIAISFGALEKAKLLIKNGATPGVGEESESLLILAAYSNDFDLVEQLLELKVNANCINKYGHRLLMGDIDEKMYTLLLSSKPNLDPVDENDVSLLSSAIISNNFTKAQLLLDNGANIDAKGDAYLHAGMISGHAETPLEHAARLGSVEQAKFLIERGAKIDMDEIRKITSYNSTGYQDIVKLLEEKLASEASPASNKRASLLMSKGDKKEMKKPPSDSTKKSGPNI